MTIRKICWTLGCLAVVFPSFAAAQAATRTWVSGVGDDANPCSRTAPCKTFAGAISKTAAGGTIDVLDPGGFGAVTITKAITIDGGHSIAGVLVSGTNAIVVNAGATDTVILRNLFIDGIGTGTNGVRFLAGGTLYVEHSVIQNFLANGIDIEPTTTNGQLFATDVAIRTSAYGVWVGGGSVTTRATIVDCQFNQISHAAVRAEAGSNVFVRGSVASNGVNGFVACNLAAGTAPVMTLEDTLATNNSGRAVGAGDLGCVAGTVYLNHTAIYGNTTGLSFGAGGALLSWGNNMVVFNGTNGAPSGMVSPK